jgi:hypothetical protein
VGSSIDADCTSADDGSALLGHDLSQQLSEPKGIWGRVTCSAESDTKLSIESLPVVTPKVDALFGRLHVLLPVPDSLLGELVEEAEPRGVTC